MMLEALRCLLLGHDWGAWYHHYFGRQLVGIRECRRCEELQAKVIRR